MSTQRVKWVLKKARGERILDIGFVGEEWKKANLHRAIRRVNPGSFVAGLDTNKELLEKYDFPNSKVGSFLDMPYKDEEFDVVVISEVIEHVLESVDGFKEIARVLKPGGRLVLTTPCAYGFFQLLKHWFLARDLGARRNYRRFLGNDDHKIFWEPLSLANILAMNGLVVTELTTRNLALPYLPSFIRNPPLHFWPFTRMGTYLCIVAEKK
ncbi:methyltransferase domain-containing protein [Patescibacteria group bacterium]|nr:methyltransferase domain-containing protein [Patescibacteria group bacterium]